MNRTIIIIKKGKCNGQEKHSDLRGTQETGRRIRELKGCKKKRSFTEDIEARIEELEKILKNAEVVVEEEADLDKVSIGCSVKILDCEFDEELEYKIVGSTEANSLKGKISNESPVGKALLGKQVGDTVTVETPAGEFSYKVLSIHRAN